MKMRIKNSKILMSVLVLSALIAGGCDDKNADIYEGWDIPRYAMSMEQDGVNHDYEYTIVIDPMECHYTASGQFFIHDIITRRGFHSDIDAPDFCFYFIFNSMPRTGVKYPLSSVPVIDSDEEAPLQWFRSDDFCGVALVDGHASLTGDGMLVRDDYKSVDISDGYVIFDRIDRNEEDVWRIVARLDFDALMEKDDVSAGSSYVTKIRDMRLNLYMRHSAFMDMPIKIAYAVDL